MQLAVLCLEAISVYANLCFEYTVLLVSLEEAGQQRHATVSGDGDEFLCAGTVGNGFCYRQQLFTAEFFGESITADRAFMERDNIRAISCRSLAHAADYGQVVSLVVVVRLKLDGRDFNGI